MKKIILILFLFVTLTIKAQDFAPIGANWYYDYDPGTAPPNAEYDYYSSVKDTVIAGKTVQKIVEVYYQYSGDTSILSPLYFYNSSDTVFLYNPRKNNFGRFFIYNQNKGDTLTLDVPYGDTIRENPNRTYRLVIDSVSTVTYNGKLLKEYATTGLDEYYFTPLMDYAGCLSSFFPWPMPSIMVGQGPLRCYSDSNLSINFEPCDYRLINSNNISNETNKHIFVYPNPAKDKITIENLDKNTSSTIEIFNISGQIVLNETVQKDNSIDISNLVPGVLL